MELLARAKAHSRPVIWLLGAGLSVDAGIPLAAQLSQYLVHFATMVRTRGFVSARHYLEESRWPSRHDLRVDLMLALGEPALSTAMISSERTASQDALVAEVRRASPTLAFSFDEIFGQLRSDRWNRAELAEQFGELRSIASSLAKRVPRNVAYRSLLFNLCDGSQALIDGCLDHFIRDRTPTTTHQLVVFTTLLLRSRVILSTNFDSLLEQAFASEGVRSRVYEIQGEGTLPSAKMLLSQQFSIVKLHGGAHQMRTGFNLDDPLSPAVLGSFYELFDGLQQYTSQNPLMIVLGYGGSDRRVMDIVSTHVKRWKLSDEPCVLWVNRDPWVPTQLRSAVETHPQVLFSDRGDKVDGKSSSQQYGNYPVHVVRYKEGRLFLLEAYQHLAGTFPIGKAPYQVVNFVPHSTVRKSNKAYLTKEINSKPDWHLMLLAAETGGGSSSQLAALAEDSDQHYRTIWIDMAEVPSVSALLDVIAERIGKFDDRLQRLRRPLLLSVLLECADGRLNEVQQITQDREIASAIKWIQHALRRGQYLLALDSLDEFAHGHPALTAKAGEAEVQMRLLCRILETLLSEPGSLGDSRIAVAGRLFTARDKVERPAEFALQERFRRKAGDDKARVHFIPLPAKASLPKDEKQRDVQILQAWETLNVPSEVHSQYLERMRNRGCPAPTNVDWNRLGQALIFVAMTSRRIRSEVLLLSAATALVRVDPGRRPTSEHSKKIREACAREVLFSRAALCHFRSGNKTNPPLSESDPVRTMLEEVLRAANSEGHGEVDRKSSWFAVRPPEPIVGGGDVGTQFDNESDQQLPLWFYRVEGGYHWMHQTVRDSLYLQLKKSQPAAVALVHHYVAAFCRDQLYDRSKDARAFLEYLFHTAAVFECVSANDFELRKSEIPILFDWLRDVHRALRREKGNLFTRARLPSLIHQMRLLLNVISGAVFTVLWRTADRSDRAGIADRCIAIISHLLRIMGDLLLAAGHPHTAVSCHIARWRLIASGSVDPKMVSDVTDLAAERNQLSEVSVSRLNDLSDDWARASIAGPQQVKRRQKAVISRHIRGGVPLRAAAEILADVANAVQDPLLASRVESTTEWIAETAGVLQRSDRIALSRRLYVLAASFCREEG